MVCESSQQLEDINFFVKCCILDVWQNTEYASVIWYSLFGKTEEANNNDSVVM